MDIDQLTQAGRQVDRAVARADKARTERDRLILEARTAGYGYRAIGRAVGLSHQQIVNIEARVGTSAN